MAHRTQNDLLQEEVMSQPVVSKENVKLPGIEVLHTKTKEEIAEVLAMILKSRGNIVSMNYVLGKSIELTLG